MLIDRIAFDILIQLLILIQVRTVALEIKDLNVMFVMLRPLLHLGGHMSWMLVSNHKGGLKRCPLDKAHIKTD